MTAGRACERWSSFPTLAGMGAGSQSIMTTTALSTTTGRADHPGRDRARVLWVACGAHALHDGLTDTLYLLLPILQTEFALSYAAIGILRALYAGAMAGLQVPTAKMTQWLGGARMLAAGTAVAAIAYLGLGLSTSCAMLVVAPLSVASGRVRSIRSHQRSWRLRIRGSAREARWAHTTLPEISERWLCRRSRLA
jgi:hypothetical protein